MAIERKPRAVSHFGLGLISSAGVPGNDAFTKILLHMDGSNGGTTFTDVAAGGSAHTWTPTNATTSTASAKFGPTSMLTASGYITTPDHADFTLGSGDFTLDCWINFNGTSGFVNVFGQSDAAGGVDSQSVHMQRAAGGLTYINLRDSAGIRSLTSTTNFNGSSGWSHFAAVKSGTTGHLYVNGIQEATTSLPNPMWDGTGAWSIGRLGDVASSPSSFYFDEFRLSVGIARWTSNFTPPVAAYS